MNVSFQNMDNVSGQLTVKVEKPDYQDLVEKQLKTLKQKANMPGFRPGMVPMGLVRKRYYTSVMAEEINKVVSEQIYAYLKENQINILGEPIPNEEQQADIDFDHMETFDFVFDVALAPAVKVDLSKDTKVNYYTVEVTDEMVNKQVEQFTMQGGSYEQVDAFEGNDMLKGSLVELDESGEPKAEGITIENAVLMPAYMKDEAQKALFAGAKKDDNIVFNPSVAFENSAAELASLLRVAKDSAADIKSNFKLTINEITRHVPGALNQELFDRVFGEGVVTTEDAFRAKIKESIAAQFTPDSDYKLLLDVRKLLEDANKIEFPEALMKRLMKNHEPDKDDQYINDHYAVSIQQLTWHLIREQLIKDFAIKVEFEDVQKMAFEITRSQFARIGMLNVEPELIENYSKSLLKDKDQVEGIVNRLIEKQLAAVLKTKVTLEEKTVSQADFAKLFSMNEEAE